MVMLEIISELQLYKNVGGRSVLYNLYTQFLEAPKPTPSIPSYNTRENAIKQLLHHHDTSSCAGVYY